MADPMTNKITPAGGGETPTKENLEDSLRAMGAEQSEASNVWWLHGHCLRLVEKDGKWDVDEL